MTKRICCFVSAYEFKDTITGKLLTKRDLADMVNELSDENEQLRRDNKEYIRGLDLRKIECQSWATDVRELREENCRLEEENKQLKQQLQKYKDEEEYEREMAERWCNL